MKENKGHTRSNKRGRGHFPLFVVNIFIKFTYKKVNDNGVNPPTPKKNKIKMNNENKELKAHYTPPPQQIRISMILESSFFCLLVFFMSLPLTLPLSKTMLRT